MRVGPTLEHIFFPVYDTKEEPNRFIGPLYTLSNFILTVFPASRIHEITGEGTLDYCFTDPQYSNDIYFLDLSTLWAAWLDLPITDQQRRNELIIGGTQRKDRSQFLREFSAALESIARALKQDAWLTLVYKHKDL